MKMGKRAAKKFSGGLRLGSEGLIPVAVCSDESGKLLMLAYANRGAVEKTLLAGKAYFFSRSRKRLWKKGETSGNEMKVASVAVDCDRDAIAYYVSVEGKGNACHLGRKSCFESEAGKGKNGLTISELAGIMDERKRNPKPGSYTCKLLASRKFALAKVREESGEFVEALEKKKKAEVAWELCDLIYHSLAAAAGRGVKLSDLEAEFKRRNKNR